jgi:hypothetical protein
MKFYKLIFFIGFLFFSIESFGQKIVYSEPDRDETRKIDFEVIGKVSGNFLIYKNSRNKNYIAVYDNDMQQLAKEEHNYIPNDRLINVDFFPYSDHAYMIYQYQRKNVVYCNAVKVDGTGKKISDIIQLDTTQIGFSASNKIYSAISSEDKSKLMIFKINSRNKSRFLITTLLFDNMLALKNRSSMAISMAEREDYLDEFALDNEGDFVFAKFNRNNNDNIENTFLIWKQAEADTLSITEINLDKILLDEPHLKVDNVNKRYFLTSFYNKQKRGNIEGFYFFVWDKETMKPAMENSVVLGEELRKEAKGDANIKMAFNDYFIRNVIVKKDGGFIIGTEAYYTTSRGGNWNRWNYLYPYSTTYDYFSYSPLYNSWYWRNRFNNNQATRHHADNITILSFDKSGRLEWSNVIHKEQFDDEMGDYISFQLINTGEQLHFVFNQEEKRQQLLNDYTITADGKINRNPTLKNLDKGFEFLPKFGKQVSARQVIIPCYFRNYVCFAKIDYSS